MIKRLENLYNEKRLKNVGGLTMECLGAFSEVATKNTEVSLSTSHMEKTRLQWQKFCLDITFLTVRTITGTSYTETRLNRLLDNLI